MTRTVGRRLRTAAELFLLGLLGFFFLRGLDVAHLRGSASAITPGVFAAIVGFQLAILILGSACWALLLRQVGISRSPWRTFLARTSGFSVTYLTPSASFAGVPARAALFRDSGMPAQTLYATIVLDTYLELAGKVPCIAAGAFILVMELFASAAARVAAALVLLFVLGFLVLITMKALSGGRLVVRLSKAILRPLARWRLALAARVLHSLRIFARDLDAIIVNRRIVLSALLCAVGIGVLEVLQTLFILSVLGAGRLTDAFVIYSSILVQGLFGILPGNLGGMEATHMLVFGVVGLDAAQALIYTVILRVGQMTVVAIGLLNILRWRIAQASLHRRAAPARTSPAPGVSPVILPPRSCP